MFVSSKTLSKPLITPRSLHQPAAPHPFTLSALFSRFSSLQACARDRLRARDFHMVWPSLAEYLFPPSHRNNDDDQSTAITADFNAIENGRPSLSQKEDVRPDMSQQTSPEMEEEEYRPPYLHAMLAGGLGGTAGDMLMHSLDTVKTRQQGDPHMPPKYTSMGNTYLTILRQEGVWRGLYGGVWPAFLGSFGGTVIFFGCYEYSKRFMIDHGVTPGLAYFSAGFFADLAASPLYVPTEVLKTRLQLQGRFNNPFFTSGYNYRSSYHALRTIVRTEGFAEMFSGYKATLFRDLPFSAIQFAIYEQEQRLARKWVGPGNDIGLGLEIFTGATAGGMAGVLTCPMDVVKTRIQTELDPEVVALARKTKKPKKVTPPSPPKSTATTTSSHRPTPSSAPNSSVSKTQKHPISTSGPSTILKHHGQVSLDTESVVKALRIIYQSEGVSGWFRGVGPRAVWTAVQSGTMLLVYQKLLKWFDARAAKRANGDDEGLRGWG